MGNCHKCGSPLHKGNIKVIRKPGKRPVRACRRCSGTDQEHSGKTSEAIQKLNAPKRAGLSMTAAVTSPIVCGECPDAAECSKQVQGEGICLRFPAWKNPPISLTGTAGNGLQRPQDTTGGPVTLEGVFHYSPPPNIRYFITQAQAEKIRKAIGKPTAAFGITVAIIPVPADQVDADPERFAELVPVEVNIKGG